MIRTIHAILAAALVLIGSTTVPGFSAATVQPVVWAGLQGTTTTGNTLFNVDDLGSGGFTKQHLASGDGYVEIPVVDPWADYIVSLGPASAFAASFRNFSAAKIAKAPYVGTWIAHFYPNAVEIREGIWLYKARRSIAKGYTIRLAIAGGASQPFLPPPPTPLPPPPPTTLRTPPT